MTSFDQSQWFISAYHNYNTPKYVYDINSGTRTHNLSNWVRTQRSSSMATTIPTDLTLANPIAFDHTKVNQMPFYQIQLNDNRSYGIYSNGIRSFLFGSNGIRSKGVGSNDAAPKNWAASDDSLFRNLLQFYFPIKSEEDKEIELNCSLIVLTWELKNSAPLSNWKRRPAILGCNSANK